jgi:hypothetical protein
MWEDEVIDAILFKGRKESNEVSMSDPTKALQHVNLLVTHLIQGFNGKEAAW